MADKILQWENGALASDVKKIIDDNFELLNRRTSEIAYGYIQDFKKDSWSLGGIYIPYSKYLKVTPCVEVYIKTNEGYENVCGGFVVMEDGVKLQSDIAYEGRVVIR